MSLKFWDDLILGHMNNSDGIELYIRQPTKPCSYISQFTKVLVQFPEVSVGVVLKLVHAHLESGRGSKGTEERGACFGKVFALVSLIQSGILKTTVSQCPLWKHRMITSKFVMRFVLLHKAVIAMISVVILDS